MGSLAKLGTQSGDVVPGMEMDMIEAMLAVLLWIVCAALVFVLPFAVVLRYGRFWVGVMIVWSVMTAFGVIGFALDHSKAMFLLASACTGWLSGIIVSLPAIVIYKLRKRKKPQPASPPYLEPAARSPQG
jgi:hypothetical protein